MILEFLLNKKQKKRIEDNEDIFNCNQKYLK